MVYKGCDIGSAKPSKSTLKRFPHEMVDIIKPSEIFTVADFYSLAKKIIDKSHSENKLPLFVGGSMMYFKSLLDGMHELPQRDNNFRERLLKLKEKNKTHFLFSLLNDKDPEYAKKLNKNDEIRIIRALEVIEKTEKPLSKLMKESKKNPLSDEYEISQFGVLDEREIIHDRIEERLKRILSDGLEEEALTLLEEYNIPANHPIRKSVNYKQIFDYLDGKYDKKTFFQKALFASRQLAKRQITWIRGWDEYTEIQINEVKVIEDRFKKIISLL
jgi:tRNA dimethylallyltransferase